MVGLEPAGTLPGPKDFEKKNLEQYLDATRVSISSELDRSFFITRQMDRQFRGQVTDGLDLADPGTAGSLRQYDSGLPLRAP